MTAIIHLFACHVGPGEWTIEQLAGWIASVEPGDDLVLTSAGREEHAFAAVDEG
jgi:hypothetical protein